MFTQNLTRCGTRLFFTLTLSALLCVGASGQPVHKIPFTVAGIYSIVGKDVCDFQGAESPEEWQTYGVYLDRAKRYSVDYKERDGVAAVFLLSKPNLVFRPNKATLTCGIVDASLDLTQVIQKDETFAFKCYTAHEGGTTWGKWGHVIGLADNDNGLKRIVKARLAWRVDIKEERFEELKGQSVTCDTSGFGDE